MFDAIAQTVQDQSIHFCGHDITLRRLDQIHPSISGNKFFKLKYNILQAKQLGYRQLLTFGGAYSNHIAATAFAAHQFGFSSVGIIRGEELAHRALNPTLQTAQDLGMHLHFVSREDYRQKEHADFLKQLAHRFPHHYVIPEGGTNALAIQGCREILTPEDSHFDLICCAVGTGGTITGLIEASLPHQRILGFSALKGNFLTQEVSKLTHHKNWKITDEYCCGGYAKTTPELLQFMSNFESQFNIPLEQVYTAKMLLGIQALILRGVITSQHRVLAIHTGGLQGRSKS